MSADVKNTKDVDLILGDPKRAMLFLMLPALLGFFVQSMDAIVDMMWVAGLGQGALAAVGYVNPIFTIMCGLGTGIGVGTAALVSRCIGHGDKDAADRTMGQGLLLSLMISLCVVVILTLFGETLLNTLTSGHYMEESVAYLTPLIITCPTVLLGLALTNMVRSEGGFKKVMCAMMLTTCVNATLDPLLIFDYGLNLGIAGAAWATGLSRTACTLLLLYFMFSKRTYVRPNFNRFRLDSKIVPGILHVGVPALMTIVFLSVTMMLLNGIATGIDHVNGVATYGTIAKAMQLLYIPTMAIGVSVLTLSAVAYGQKDYDKVSTVYKYGLKIAMLFMTVVGVIIFIAAEQFMTIFTYAEGTEALKEELVLAIRTNLPFIILFPLQYVTTYLFQALGRGARSFIPGLISYGMAFIAVVVVTGTYSTMEGFWLGYSIGGSVGLLLSGLWGLRVVRLLPNERAPSTTT